MINFKLLIAIVTATLFAWETYLNLRQRRTLKIKKVPSALKKIVTEKQFSAANAYGLDKLQFALFSNLFSLIQTYVVIDRDVLPMLWAYSGTLNAHYLGLDESYEIYHSLTFFSILMLGSMTLNTPLSLYSTFVIEQKHGFNKQTIGLFFSDMLKGLFIGALIGLPVLAGFLKIIISAGENFYFYLWVFMLSFQIIMVMIFPTFIQPLFNKFTPLPDSPLRKKINALAASIQFPLTKLYLVDGSKRSSHSNAYFYGFFKNKRIVLFDTLLKDANEPEIVAILAHELGHWKHNHVFKTLAISQLHLFTLFYTFSLCITYPALYTDFAFTTKPVIVGFLLFQYIYTPIDTIFSFGMNMISRMHEFQAGMYFSQTDEFVDKFAKTLGMGKELQSGLVKLHIKNMGSLCVDSLYSTWYYSHPPVVERLDALKQE